MHEIGLLPQHPRWRTPASLSLARRTDSLELDKVIVLTAIRQHARLEIDGLHRPRGTRAVCPCTASPPQTVMGAGLPSFIHLRSLPSRLARTCESGPFTARDSVAVVDE